MKIDHEDIAAYTAPLAGLLDKYRAAVANAYRPDNDTAIATLTEVRDRVEGALALLTGLPPERKVYREALDEIIGDEYCDPVQVAHDAITPYTQWRAATPTEAAAIDAAVNPRGDHVR